MPIRRWGMALVLLVGAASGCSPTETETPSKGPQEIAVPEPDPQVRQLTIPFDAYNFSPAEDMTLDVAEDVVVRDCMNARGLAWQALPGPGESEIEPPHRRRYGVIESRVADVFGYHAPPYRPAVAARGVKALARVTGAPPGVREAAKACLKQARASMYGGAQKADAAFFNKVIFATFDAAQRDRRVTRAFRSWSACMAEEGFRYADPLAAITDRRWSTKAPTTQEIRTAQRDVLCKEKTGVVSIWAAAETRVQNAAIRAHPGKFRELRAVKVRQLAAARRVLG
ncbi:hypothetical protein ACIBKY_46905 [Nonomuraea sp. NPDC050394]|uniref:hypothetical protein n=1 Tax=Nonomuraea sp. NPDC050394 TaxID=3364363 RepID=UPI0037B39846